MSELNEFRQDVRSWLEKNCPESLRTPTDRTVWGGRNFKFASSDEQLWLERMAEQGWTVPTWPVEYGGAGLSRAQDKVLKQEMRRIKARSPLESFGIWMLGPALLKFGNAEQKQRFLPEIARGEVRWCQGYSEPGAGSDLASLSTRCEDKGDHFLINGQKIWTSYADQADAIFCLVRTDFEARKHNGISFVLIDMDQPGVTTRPIQLISGASPFCETFFDDAKAPKENLVGELNGGWTIAKYLLTHERESISGIGQVGHPRATVRNLALEFVGLEDGKLADPVLRDRVARDFADNMAMALTLERLTDEAKAGASLGANSSMLKLVGSELGKRSFELRMALLGEEGLRWDGGELQVLTATWLRSKGYSIEGGTSEVQLNIIAKRILDLPA